MRCATNVMLYCCLTAVGAPIPMHELALVPDGSLPVRLTPLDADVKSDRPERKKKSKKSKKRHRERDESERDRESEQEQHNEAYNPTYD